MSIFDEHLIETPTEILRFQSYSQRFIKKRLKGYQEQMCLFYGNFEQLNNLINSVLKFKVNVDFMMNCGVMCDEVVFTPIASLDCVHPKVLCTEFVKLLGSNELIPLTKMTFHYVLLKNSPNENAGADLVNIVWE